MSDMDAAIARARAVKEKYEVNLLQKKNVIGIGIGFEARAGQLTDTVALIVNVRKKVAEDDLSPQDLLPETLEGVPVDVVEVGVIRAL